MEDCGEVSGEEEDVVEAGRGGADDVDGRADVSVQGGRMLRVFSLPPYDGGSVGVRDVPESGKRDGEAAGPGRCKKLRLRGVGCNGVGMVTMRDKLVHLAPGGMSKTVVLDLALRGARTRAGARLARTAFESGASSLVVGGRGGVPMGLCVLHDRHRGRVDPCGLSLGMCSWISSLLEDQGHTGAPLWRIADMASQQFGFPFETPDQMISLMGSGYDRDTWLSVSPFVRRSESTIETILSRAASVRCFCGPPGSGKMDLAMKQFLKRKRKVTIVDSSRVDVPSVSGLLVFRGAQCMDTQRLAEVLERAPNHGLEVCFVGDKDGSTFSSRPGRPFLAMVRPGSPFDVLYTKGKECFADISAGRRPRSIPIISSSKEMHGHVQTRGGDVVVFDSMGDHGEVPALCEVVSPPLGYMNKEWQFRKKEFEGKFVVIRVNAMWSRQRLREVCGCASAGFGLYVSESVLACVLEKSEDRVFHQNLFGSALPPPAV